MEAFLTPCGAGRAETRVRGSVFVAVAGPAAHEAAAAELLASQQRAYFQASHHCSAWRLRGGEWRANDAGEPSGSAGAPILAAIHGAGLVDCAVVVTRWFGGTKLGVGGLVRAYGDAAARALEAAPRHLGVAALRLRVRYPFEYTSPVMRALEWTAASGVEHGFDAESGMPESCFAIRASLLGDLESWLLNQTAGGVAPMVLGECVLHEAPGTAS